MGGNYEALGSRAVTMLWSLSCGGASGRPGTSERPL